MKNFQKTGDLRSKFAYGDFKDLNRKLVLLDKAFNITKKQKYEGYQRGLVLVDYKYFDEKPLVEQLKLTLFLM